MATEFANMNPIENDWYIMKKEIGNQMQCKKKKICGSEYVKHCIEKHRTSWKNFTIQCQGELQILLKKMEAQRNTDFMM